MRRKGVCCIIVWRRTASAFSLIVCYYLRYVRGFAPDAHKARPCCLLSNNWSDPILWAPHLGHLVLEWVGLGFRVGIGIPWSWSFVVCRLLVVVLHPRLLAFLNSLIDESVGCAAVAPLLRPKL